MKSIWDTEELANHWSLSFEEVQFLLERGEAIDIKAYRWDKHCRGLFDLPVAG